MTSDDERSNDLAVMHGVEGRKSKAEDGRRNNRPPVAKQIQPGEIRNPDGRRGKAKSALSEFDRHYLAEAARIVSRGETGPVSSLQRLIQEEWHNALVKGDEKSRARVLAEAKDISARCAVRQESVHDWFVDCKLKYEATFATAQALKRLPPDVPHPDHVIVTSDSVEFRGPIERKARKAWEHLKCMIKVAAIMHEHARKRIQWDPSPQNLDDLKAIEKHRRMLMRKVPTGWNWQEEIYTRHDDAKIAADAIKFLKEQWDAECRTRDRVLARRKRKAIAS